jgi:uncharacterized membrane protein
MCCWPFFVHVAACQERRNYYKLHLWCLLTMLSIFFHLIDRHIHMWAYDWLETKDWRKLNNILVEVFLVDMDRNSYLEELKDKNTRGQFPHNRISTRWQSI